MQKSPNDSSTPCYELRACHHGIDDMELSVWQLPAAATPNLTAPQRLAGLRGRNLALAQHYLTRHLKQEKIRLDSLPPKGRREYPLSEDAAMMLGLLFRALAPMRNRDNMSACAEGIAAMTREESAYWLGMTLHRRYPRRVLSALRILLTEPAHRAK
jgi:hypothetical protein